MKVKTFNVTTTNSDPRIQVVLLGQPPARQSCSRDRDPPTVIGATRYLRVNYFCLKVLLFQPTLLYTFFFFIPTNSLIQTNSLIKLFSFFPSNSLIWTDSLIKLFSFFPSNSFIWTDSLIKLFSFFRATLLFEQLCYLGLKSRPTFLLAPNIRPGAILWEL